MRLTPTTLKHINTDYTVSELDMVIIYDAQAAVLNIQLPNPALGMRHLKFIKWKLFKLFGHGLWN